MLSAILCLYLFCIVVESEQRPELEVTYPTPCKYICRSFSTFILQCKFTPPAMFVLWNVANQTFVDLKNIIGFFVDETQLSEGIVTLTVLKKIYNSYACNVVFHGGHPIVSNTIEEEGTEMSGIVVAVSHAANKVTLTWTPSYAHCYELSCYFQHLSGGNPIPVDMNTINNSVVMPEPALSGTYEVMCNATQPVDVNPRQFTTGNTTGGHGTLPPQTSTSYALFSIFVFCAVFITIAIGGSSTSYVILKKKGKQAATYAVRENDLNSRGDLEQQKDSEPENAPEQDKAVQEQNPEENLQNMQCLSGVT